MTILLIEEILSISDQIIAGSEEEIGKSPEFQGNPRVGELLFYLASYQSQLLRRISGNQYVG